MDQSVTVFLLKYLWKCGKYFGQELLSPNMSNSKAFLIAIASSAGFSCIQSRVCFCPLLLQTGYIMSIMASVFEGIGLLLLCANIYILHVHPFNQCDRADCEMCTRRNIRIFGKDV